MADEGTATCIEIDTTKEDATCVKIADQGTATCIEIDTTNEDATCVEADGGIATGIAILVAIILPFLGVLLKLGCKDEFWICLLLTFFGHLPGLIYAVYVIIK